MATLTLKQYLEEVLPAAGVKESSVSEDSVLYAAFEAKEQFMKEWLDGFDEDDTPSIAQIEAAEEAVDEAIQQDFMDSVTYKQGEALADAAQRMADKTDAEMQFSYDRDTGEVIVELDDSFVQVWAEAVEGQGYFAWDEETELSDVKSVAQVVDVLKDWGEVYGYSLTRMYDNEWDGWEPGGRESFGSLSLIAEKAVKETA